MMSEAQADMVLVEAGNLPVVPDTGLEDMELGDKNLGDKNLGECTRCRRVGGLGILVPE